MDWIGFDLLMDVVPSANLRKQSACHGFLYFVNASMLAAYKCMDEIDWFSPSGSLFDFGTTPFRF
jgi:hypothetical protein